MSLMEEVFELEKEQLKKVEQDTKCFFQQTAGQGDFKGFVNGVIEVSDNEKELWRGMVFGHLLRPYINSNEGGERNEERK